MQGAILVVLWALVPLIVNGDSRDFDKLWEIDRGADPSLGPTANSQPRELIRNKRRGCPSQTLPPAPPNSFRRCLDTVRGTCNYVCKPGHFFPNGERFIHLECPNRIWTPQGVTWGSMGGCQPCNPPCLNGGICTGISKCQCNGNFKGPQCQYKVNSCSTSDLIFNGELSCQSSADATTCVPVCPANVQFESPPEAFYRCTFASGEFSPKTIPQCSSCTPACQNDGVCVGTNTCQCKSGFTGAQCETVEKVCTDPPTFEIFELRHANISCTTRNCTIECSSGYTFPGGNTTTDVFCKDGLWVPGNKNWPTVTSVPDCEPVCDPPCLNEGVCENPNKCKCLKKFKGRQCQYPAHRCAIKKLVFNGVFNCTWTDEQKLCIPSCPNGGEFESPPAQIYSCDYEKKEFTPKTIPQCVCNKVPPAAPQNARSKCSSESSCTISCDENYEFPNGKTEVVALCVDNLWKFGEENWTTLPDCKRSIEDVNDYGDDVVKSFPNITTPETPGSCVFWGGTHIKTFDGYIMSFKEGCAYTLLKDTKSTFTINVDKSTSKNCKTDQCALKLEIFIEDVVFHLENNQGRILMTQNKNQSIPIPVQTSELSVQHIGPLIVIKLTAFGVTLKWDAKMKIQVDVTEHLWNKTSGLCGRLDGNESNDLEGRNGKVFDSISALLSTWESKSLGAICKDQPIVDNPCTSSKREAEAKNFCAKLRDDFLSCHKVIDKQRYYDACLWDFCSSESDQPSCQTMSIFVDECKRKGVQFSSDWRTGSSCEMKCTGGAFYKQCGPASQATCFSASDVHQPAEFCVEGCFCPDGTVQHEGVCIQKEQCPCQHGGKTFKSRFSIAQKCNTCFCKGGRWNCQDTKCSSSCSVISGRHFTTFDGKSFSFSGKCGYQLLKMSNLSIEADIEQCPGAISDANSCTKSITVRYDGNMIKLKQRHEIVVNDREVTKLPVESGKVRIRRLSSMFIIAELDSRVLIWWDGASRIYIDVPASFEGKTQGLCGTFTGKQTDDFLTSEGDVEQEVSAFVNKWKVRDTCPNVEHKITPKPCDANPEKRAEAERLCGILKTGKFSQCSWQVDSTPFYENCIDDVCACESEISDCLCPILANYGQACSDLSVTLDWRKDVPECGVQCPLGQIFQPCTSFHSRSCLDFSTVKYGVRRCVEGCNCPNQRSFDKNENCVKYNQCPCLFEGREYSEGSREIRQNLNGTQLCICQHARWGCRSATDDDIRLNPNSTIPTASCNATKNLEFTSCVPEEPNTCKNLHIKDRQSLSICKSGCQCKKGFVLDPLSGLCVDALKCPCHHGGRSYKDGDVVQEKCRTCKCNNSSWNCSPKICTGTCTAWGESHFKTFDGRLYDFQGICSYALVQSKVSPEESFVVSIQSVICGSEGATCVRSVTIDLGADDGAESITLSKDKKLPPKSSLKRATVRDVGLYVVVEVSDLGLVVLWDKGTRVYVNLDHKWKNKVRGLCGNFNDNELDDFRTPSGGVSEVSAKVFGNSWKLQPQCPEPTDPKDHCSAHPMRKAWATEKCGILQSVFQPCHSQVEVEHYYQSCLQDACSCELTITSDGICDCLCTAISAYAQVCNENGVPIKWRKQEFCPIQCDKEGSKYSPCVSTCPPETCENVQQMKSLTTLCKTEACIEGCQPKRCPDGLILKSEKEPSCVAVSSCRPVCIQRGNSTFYEGDLMDSDACHSCHCSHQQRVCQGEPCTTTSLLKTTPSPQETTTPSLCPPGYEWRDCLYNCDTACHSFQVELKAQGFCSGKARCKPGCAKIGEKCDGGRKWRDEHKCVQTKDCTCLAKNGTLVQPGGVITENECSACQCVNNELHCVPQPCDSDSKTTTPHYPSTTDEMENFRHETSDLPKDQEFTTVPTTIATIKNTLTPPHHCNPENFVPIVSHLEKSAFSASSSFNDQRGPQKAKIVQETSQNTWLANENNKEQFLQVDLGESKPIYAVLVRGSPQFNQYVTSYKILYSNDGFVFSELLDESGAPKIFRGPIDSNEASKVVLPAPFEARFVRIYPQTWERRIAMQIELFGCTSVDFKPTTTIAPPVTSDCDSEMGMRDGRVQFGQFSASSVLKGKVNKYGPHFARLDGLKAWKPHINSPNEWITIDLTGPRELTGISTQGDALTNSWITAYNVLYSQDGQIWNTILDASENEKLFVANVDATNAFRNNFDRTISAQYIKLVPQKWSNNGIGARIEIYGCFKPYTPLPPQVTPIPPPEGCNCCPYVPNEKRAICKPCSQGLLWSGEKCVRPSDCLCFTGHQNYTVGAIYKRDNCVTCTCTLGGVSQCKPKVCPACKKSDRHGVLTSACTCVCKPCPEGSLMCPTSRDCVAKDKWCDGIEHCTDDEFNCDKKDTPPPPTPSCAPEPECAEGFEATVKKQVDGEKALQNCPEYICAPKPDRNCTLEGKSLVTIDGAHLHVDICDQILVQNEDWNITVTKNCLAGDCSTYLSISHQSYSLKIYSNSTVTSNGYFYELTEAQPFATKYRELEIYKTGDLIRFESNHFGFSLILNDQGDFKIKVPAKTKGEIKGLCGLLNGKIDDDKTKPDGSLASSTTEFTKSWKVPHSQLDCTQMTCSTESKDTAHKICMEIKEKALSLNKCDSLVEWNSFLHTCIDKTCECLKNDREQNCKCKASTNYVSKCIASSPPDLDLSTWRIELGCSADCPPNQVHYDCYKQKCALNCNNLDTPCKSDTNVCSSGCFCKEGLVLKGDKCVRPDECKPCICESSGGPQYTTFDRLNLTLNGNCSYIAARDISLTGQHQFEIIITKVECRNEPGTTCIEGVTVLHQNHVVRMMRDEGQGKITNTMNGKILNKLPLSNNWMRIESTSSDQMTLFLKNMRIEVSYYFQSNGFAIRMPSTTFANKTEGLCGKCTKKIIDNSRTSTALVNASLDISEPNWTVQNLPEGIPFEEHCKVLDLPKCTLPPSTEDPCLAILDKTLFGKCHILVDPQPYLKRCQQHICHSNSKNETVCGKVADYAKECRRRGLCLEWRSEGLCPYECPSTFEYKPCGSGCQGTCENTNKPCKLEDTEGCSVQMDKVKANAVVKDKKCVPESSCKVCDDEGHRLGDTWRPDKCTSCKCEEPEIKTSVQSSALVKTCESQKCSVVVCNLDEKVKILPGTENDCCPKEICIPKETDCMQQTTPECTPPLVLKNMANDTDCPKMVCDCIPKEDCPPVKSTNERLKPGMVRKIDNSGCCPHEILTCEKNKCVHKECPEFQKIKVVTGTEDMCCPVEQCVPFEDMCIFEAQYTAAESGGERLRTPKERSQQALKVNATWYESPCRKCECIENQNSVPQVQCTTIKCSDDENTLDYEFTQKSSKGTCCPEFLRTACKVGSKLYQEGEKWKSETNTCVEFECKVIDGILQKVSSGTKCDKNCKIGFQYEAPKGVECCGKCVQVACVVDGKLHSIGTEWKSEDKCTNYTCEKSEDLAQIASHSVMCPHVRDCPKERLRSSSDGCCQICDLIVVNRLSCEARVSAEETIALVNEYNKSHGKCFNAQPIEGFKECVGACESRTRYGQEDGQASVSDCNCCQAQEYELIDVNVECEDGYKYIKKLKIPSKCSCDICSGNLAGNFLNHFVNDQPSPA